MSIELERELRRQISVTRWLALMLVVTAAAVVYVALTLRQRPAVVVAPEPRVVTPRSDLGADEQTTIEVFRAASPSVVNITAIDVQRDLFSSNVMNVPKGSGSGFVWDAAGHVVTNFHVVQAGDRANVTLADGTTYPAKLVGVAPDKDLAVLRISAPPEKITPLALGTSTDLQVGQKVLAIGNPFGFDQTLTAGVISGLERTIQSITQRTIRDVIQTDAPINPGNSGGPLLDSSGRLIGVNTAIFSPSGASAGIGFAVPVDTVLSIVPQLIKFGKIIKPGLGIIYADRIAQQLRIAGIVVLEVVPGSAAEKAGLRGATQAQGRVLLGDVILEVDGTPTRNGNELMDVLERHKVGDEVSVRVRRGSGETTLTLTLQ